MCMLTESVLEGSEQIFQVEQNVNKSKQTAKVTNKKFELQQNCLLYKSIL